MEVFVFVHCKLRCDSHSNWSEQHLWHHLAWQPPQSERKREREVSDEPLCHWHENVISHSNEDSGVYRPCMCNGTGNVDPNYVVILFHPLYKYCACMSYLVSSVRFTLNFTYTKKTVRERELGRNVTHALTWYGIRSRSS